MDSQQSCSEISPENRKSKKKVAEKIFVLPLASSPTMESNKMDSIYNHKKSPAKGKKIPSQYQYFEEQGSPVASTSKSMTMANYYTTASVMPTTENLFQNQLNCIVESQFMRQKLEYYEKELQEEQKKNHNLKQRAMNIQNSKESYIMQYTNLNEQFNNGIRM